MPLIPFPNVPNVPGVPAILRSITVPTPGALLNMALGGVAEAIFGKVVWGVFSQGGSNILNPDTFISVDFRNDMRVANYPQEKGAFASYNKVATPYDCRIKMAIGADKSARTLFLSICDGMLKSTELYTVITPEVSYASAALQNYNYQRQAQNGVSMLIVELDFIEVRLTATADFSQVDKPQQADGADPVSGGQVQTFAVPAPQVQMIGAVR